jgi:predicted restriction endonuclease
MLLRVDHLTKLESTGKRPSHFEAAHITPYLGPESNHVSNGLLLRADIHTLLDLDLIGIDPVSLKLVVAEQLRGTCYDEMDGQELNVPDDAALAPNKEALQQRWAKFNEDN